MKIEPNTWRQPQMSRALARRDVAAVFRLLIQTGIRQRELAEFLGWQQSAVSDVIHGRKVQSYDVLERICAALGIPRGQMGLSYGNDEYSSTQRSDDQTSLATAVSTVLFGKAVLNELSPLPVSSGPPARLGIPDEAQIADFTARFRALDRAHGGVAFAATVDSVARRLSSMFDVAATDTQRRRLGVALGDLHCLAGWTAFDSGQMDAARWHYLRALELAATADDQVLAAHVLYSIGRLYQHHGEPNEALKYYQLATVKLDGRSGDGRACPALLAASAAWACAQIGDRNTAQRYLDSAQDYWAGDRSTTPVVGIIGGFALLAMDRLEQGVNAVNDYLRARGGDPTHARTRCRSLARLATAHLHDGNLAEGTAAATMCLSLVRELSSQTARDQLTSLRAAAASRRDSTCQDLAEQVRVIQGR
jgi:transcriptional regulator with XRE-family HTH domain/tetratricopeptide (TPR) repeat protein